MTAPGAPRTIGRWVVEGELGRGGMGVVFKAHDPTSGRAAAVKVMLDPDPEGQARFDRELEAMERLDHPGIVRLLERGRAEGRVRDFHRVHSSLPGGEVARPAQVAKALESIDRQRRAAKTPIGRLEVVWQAVELLCHAGGFAPTAVEWAERACRADVRGPRENAYLLPWAFALRSAGRTLEGLALLDRVIDDDPLDADALQARGWIRLQLTPRTQADLEAAAADARRSARSGRGSRSIAMRGGYKNSWLLLAQAEEARGDMEAAWRACERFGDDAAKTDDVHRDVRERIARARGKR